MNVSKPFLANGWLVKNPNWFEGFAHKTPTTNNALESFNNVIKREQTLRQRIDLAQFRVVLFDMVRQWTVEYEKGLNKVSLDQSISLELWTNSYNFARSNIKIIRTKNSLDGTVKYTMLLPIKNESDRWAENSVWNTFHEFRRYMNSSVHAIFSDPISAENWMSGVCDCSQFFKKYLCEHIIGIAIRLKLVAVPTEAKNVPIGQKRKRGRPAKAKPALNMQ